LCHFPENEQEKNLTIAQVSFDVVVVSIPTIKSPLNEEIKIKEKDGKSFTLTCVVEAFPSNLFNNSIKWTKESIDYFENNDAHDVSEINAMLANKTKITTNDTHITVAVTVDKAAKKHNGTYICNIIEPMLLDKSFGKRIEKRTSVLIQSAPIAMITFAKAIGKNRIFLNWTVTDNGNSPITMILPQLKVS
jgi:protein-tyrosine phosphatase